MTTTSIHGYADRISVAPGERISFMVSCEGAEQYRADIVRLINGDTNPGGPGFKEQLVETVASGDYAARHQPLYAGAHVLVEDRVGQLALTEALTLHAFIWPTTPTKGSQGILTRWLAESQAGYGLVLDVQGRLALWLGDGSGRITTVSAETPLLASVWYSVAATYDATRRRVSLYQEPIVNATNGLLAQAYVPDGSAFVEVSAGDVIPRSDAPFLMAGYSMAMRWWAGTITARLTGRASTGAPSPEPS